MILLFNSPSRLASRRAILGAGLGVAAFPVPAAFPALADTRAPLPTLREGNGQFVEFEPAAKVPDFALLGLDGRQISLHRFLGAPLVVNFWASWCPPCRQELPLLDRLNHEAAPGAARAIAISLDRGGARTVRPFLNELAIRHLPVFLDPDFRVARRAEDATSADPFRLFGLPLSYLLSPSGRNLGYFRGVVDWRAPAAQDLLAAANAAG